jgi:hypothetical protein
MLMEKAKDKSTRSVVFKKESMKALLLTTGFVSKLVFVLEILFQY